MTIIRVELIATTFYPERPGSSPSSTYCTRIELYKASQKGRKLLFKYRPNETK